MKAFRQSYLKAILMMIAFSAIPGICFADFLDAWADLCEDFSSYLFFLLLVSTLAAILADLHRKYLRMAGIILLFPVVYFSVVSLLMVCPETVVFSVLNIVALIVLFVRTKKKESEAPVEEKGDLSDAGNKPE